MASNEIHIGDIGTVFELTMMDGESIVDISSATNMLVNFAKPDGTTVSKTGSFKTNGTDGILYYMTIADDLDIPGTWKIQAKVTLDTGTWSSDISKFKVYSNLI